jgi:hypothetical protein
LQDGTGGRPQIPTFPSSSSEAELKTERDIDFSRRGMEGIKSDGKKRAMVTFDIDGTLIVSTGLSSNRLHRKAFAYALQQVFGINDASIDVIPVMNQYMFVFFL